MLKGGKQKLEMVGQKGELLVLEIGVVGELLKKVGMRDRIDR